MCSGGGDYVMFFFVKLREERIVSAQLSLLGLWVVLLYVYLLYPCSVLVFFVVALREGLRGKSFLDTSCLTALLVLNSLVRYRLLLCSCSKWRYLRLLLQH